MSAKFTKEQVDHNAKRFLHAAGLGPDPDKDNPTMAESLNEAQAKAEPPADPPATPATEAPSTPAAEDAAPAPVPAPATEPPVTPAAPAAEPTPEPEPEPEIEPEVPSGLTRQDVLEIAQTTAQKTVEAIRPEVRPSNFEQTLPTAYKADLKAIRHMEQTGQVAKGAAQKMIDFYQREEGYIADWEKKNPGQPFNPDAEEHTGLYRQMPQLDSNLLSAARDEVKEIEIEEKVMRRLEPKLREQNAQAKAQQAAPIIGQEANNAVIGFIEEAAPDLAKQVFGEDKVLTQKTIAALEEADPIAFEHIYSSGEKVRLVAEELLCCQHLGEHFVPKNKPVRLVSTGELFNVSETLSDFASNLERNLIKLPAKDTLKEGRKFLTQNDFVGRQQAILQNATLSNGQKETQLRELSERNWMLDEETILHSFKRAEAKKVENKLQKIKSVLDKRGVTTATPAPKPAVTPPVTPAPKPANTMGSRNPPSTASASDKIDPSNAGANGEKSNKEKIIEAMWG